MSQKIEVLNKVTIFKALDNKILKKIESLLEKRVIYEGEEIAVINEKASFFFILVSGRIMLSTIEEKAVVLKDHGSFIGFGLLFSNDFYNVTLKSLADGEVFLIDRNKFLALIQDDSLVEEKIMSEWSAYLSKIAPFIGAT